MKHPQIRAALLSALRSAVTGSVTWFDGRPGYIGQEDLPAVAVYLTDAQYSGGDLDEEIWSADLHIEVFLKATDTDSALDAWMEDKIIPVLNQLQLPEGLVETMSAAGYDYQRDDEAVTWGSADLKYSLTYSM
jgi:hypothetical protein